MYRISRYAILALCILAGVALYVMPPIQLGWQGEAAVGLYRFGIVRYDSDPVGNLAILERLGGPLFALQLIANGAPWMTDCPSGPCQ